MYGLVLMMAVSGSADAPALFTGGGCCSDSPGRPICSMNATCRQVDAPRPTELSYDIPVSSSPSSGTAFHSLQATSQALQPMQTDVSVKKPTGSGPWARLFVSGDRCSGA